MYHTLYRHCICIGIAHLLTHYLVKMGLNSQKLVLFDGIEQIMNFSVICGYPYLFLVHLVKNLAQMSQKWAKIHLSPVSF